MFLYLAVSTRSTSSSGGRSSGGMEYDRGLLARPLVIPETFYDTGSWSDWSFHFENVAAVNGWKTRKSYTGYECE